MIEKNLKEIISPFIKSLTTKYLNLTPKEVQVASLVKEGKTTKEIADFLNTSTAAIDFHRNHIRMKLGLKNNKINLRTYLLTSL
jgi:DNA-binding CsgD family transcriptional regulator